MVESGFLGFLDFVRSDFYISGPHPNPRPVNFSRRKSSKFLIVGKDTEPEQTKAVILVAWILEFLLLAYMPLP